MVTNNSGSNYFKEALSEVYGALQREPISWPPELNHSQRIAFVTKLLEFHEFVENFEICVNLRNLLVKMHTEQK